MKRHRQLLLLGIIMVGLLGAYFFLKQKPFAKAPPPPAASTKPAIVLAQLDQAQINKLVIKSSKANLTFVKQKGGWQTEPAQPYELDQDRIITTVSTFAALTATELIDEQPDELQQYGLAQPTVTVTVYTAGKTTGPVTLHLGDPTPVGGNYYAQRLGDPKVYAISGADGGRFLFTLNDLRNRDLPRIDPEQCQYFKLIRPGQSPVELTENPARDKTGADYGMNNWILVQPYQEALTVDVEKFSQTILPALQGLEKQEYIADQPANLAQYGLDRPRYDLTVKDKTGQTLHLLIGKERDPDYFYAKTPEAPAVFTISNSILPILTVKPFELVNRLGYIINIDTVDKITVEAGGLRQTFTLSRKVKKARSKQEQDETVTTYRMDGKPVKEDVFKTFYRSLIGLAFEGDHPGTLPESNPTVQTTFYLNQGTPRVCRINYVSYNNDFYAVFRNGHSEFLVSKDQVNAMLKDFKALVQGKLKARDL